jgi:hypothetical protein
MIKEKWRFMSGAIVLIILGLYLIVGPWPKVLEMAVLYSFSQNHGLTVSDLIGTMLFAIGSLLLVRRIMQGRDLKKP